MKLNMSGKLMPEMIDLYRNLRILQSEFVDSKKVSNKLEEITARVIIQYLHLANNLVQMKNIHSYLEIRH